MNKKITILLCVLLFIGSMAILTFSIVKAQSAQCTVGDWVYIQGWDSSTPPNGLILDNGIKMGPSKELDLNNSTIKNGKLNQGATTTVDMPSVIFTDKMCPSGYYMCGLHGSVSSTKRIICCHP